MTGRIFQALPTQTDTVALIYRIVGILIQVLQNTLVEKNGLDNFGQAINIRCIKFVKG
jgi:hypothetical protein